MEIYAPSSEKGTPARIIGRAVFTSIFLFFKCTNIAHTADGIKQNRFRLCADCCPVPRNILAAGISSIPPPTPMPLSIPERNPMIELIIFYHPKNILIDASTITAPKPMRINLPESLCRSFAPSSAPITAPIPVFSMRGISEKPAIVYTAAPATVSGSIIMIEVACAFFSSSEKNFCSMSTATIPPPDAKNPFINPMGIPHSSPFFFIRIPAFQDGACLQSLQ